MALFWGNQELFIGYYEVARETGSQLAPKTVPLCNSIQHRASLQRNLKMSNSPYCSAYICYSAVEENLIQNQDIWPLFITFVILVTFVFD